MAISSLVPVLSYVMQGGQARCCGARIDPIHPAAEFGAAVIGAVSGLLSLPQAIVSAWFGWILLALALIDLRTFRLPNPMVALLAASGLGASLQLGVPSAADSLIGAAVAYASLEAVRLVYRRARGRDGLGRGDPKMFAAIGAWVGWAPLPLVLLLASLTGLGWAVVIRLAGRRIAWSDRMPFGVLLAIAAWPVWLWQVAAEVQP